MSTIMSKTMICAAAIMACGVFASQAHAMTGREAIKACDKKKGCEYHLDSNDNIIVTVGGHAASCPGASGTCVPILRTVPGHSTEHDTGKQGSFNGGGNGPVVK